MEVYFDFFNQIHPIEKHSFELLKASVKTVSFNKGEMIIVPGQVARNCYFVLSGVQMSFFETESNSHVLAFTYNPSLCSIPESFLNQSESKCYLKALTKSSMAEISYETLQQLFNQSQDIERLFRKLTESILAGMINRHIELQALSILERYQSFCNRSPHLLQLVPHKYIASYLHINPTNFSKLYNNVKI